MTRVGIPRALSYYRYFPLWESFLEECGIDVVCSNPTNPNILDMGISQSVDDICLPVKCYFGHLLDLNDKVDFILVERILTPEGNLDTGFTCPKLMALLDMVKHSLDVKPRILEFCLDSKKHSLAKALGKIAKSLGISKRRALQAMRVAVERQKTYRLELRQTNWNLAAGCPSREYDQKPLTQKTPVASQKNNPPGIKGEHPVKFPARRNPEQKKDLDIAVVGHEYLLFDKFLNHDICGKLERLGARVQTSAALPEEIIEREIQQYKDISWVYERDLIGAASYFLSSGTVDGVIFLICFACGPDSITMEIINREINPKKRPPVMTLVIDEHTGDAGILTRLEAFIDMARRG